ncbi:hypothetical protein O988_05019 [Pseudogymnoascus sp. VKM F-3808]|nr:hypothetical protein O988_05019 [Pseudogymnoascus sp. VKM F-3808]
MLGESGQDQFVQSNIAIWILTSASAAFLFVRLYCRLRFSSVWWDDFVLTVSWLLLLVAAALLSSAITTGYETDDDKRKFFLLHHVSTSMTTIATAWSKVSFAITLTRIIHERILKCILLGVIVTANMVIILGIVSIWIPACGDPRAIYRPEHKLCYQLRILQYLGGVTIVYGGVIDISLALCPWFVIRKLLLQKREKIGLAIAMGLGILTGTIVILRAFFQFIQIDNTYHFMVFMSIFNFLEPAVSIIAQTIPMFRVLFIRAIHTNSTLRGGVREHSCTSRADLTRDKSNSLEQGHWDGREVSDCPEDQIHELLSVQVCPSGRVVMTKPYDSGVDDEKLSNNRSCLET